MKQVKVTVKYKVPSWNFCNYDTGRGVSNVVCRFCEKRGPGYHCQLYDTPLKFDGTLIDKNRTCCKNTAGFGIEISEPEVPTVDPKELMRQTLQIYNKTLNELLRQGYPRQIAEQVAQSHLLGNK